LGHHHNNLSGDEDLAKQSTSFMQVGSSFTWSDWASNAPKCIQHVSGNPLPITLVVSQAVGNRAGRNSHILKCYLHSWH
jgi:hypothetical protein